jgi:hypothetical protein
MNSSSILMIVCISTVCACSAPAQTPHLNPGTTWNPTALAVEVDAGGTSQQEVVCRATRHLPAVEVHIPPELAPYLVAYPATFGPLKRGDTQDIVFRFGITPDVAPQDLSGIITIWNGQVHLATGLPVRLRVNEAQVETLSVDGVSLEYPASWHLDEEGLSAGAPLSLDNFAGGFVQGGLLPPGGGNIVMTFSPVPAIPLSDFIDRELATANILSIEAVDVGGTVATKVTYTESYDPGPTLKEVGVYVLQSERLVKLYLRYLNEDPGDVYLNGVFEDLLDSVVFTGRDGQ